MKPAVRIGLVGCGRWGRNILRDLVTLGCSVVVADPDAAAREQALGAGARGAVPDWRSLAGTVDGYVVATPTSRHAELAAAILATGRPVFIEKPMADDLAAAGRLAATGLGRLFVMHKWAYHPGIEGLAGIVASGEFGPLHMLHLRRLQWGQPHADADAVAILAVHDLTILQAILGGIPALQAVAGAWDARGVAGFTAIFGGQPAAVLEASSIWPRQERTIVLSFEAAIVSLEDPLADHLAVRLRRDTVGIARHSEPDERRPIATELPLLRELRAFAGHLAGGPPPKTGVAEGLEAVRAMVALRSGLADRSRPPPESP